MCGACAVLNNAPDWVDRVGNPEGIGHSENLTRGAERHRDRRCAHSNESMPTEGTVTAFADQC
jgi:hypothetical protein